MTILNMSRRNNNNLFTLFLSTRSIQIILSKTTKIYITTTTTIYIITTTTKTKSYISHYSATINKSTVNNLRL